MHTYIQKSLLAWGRMAVDNWTDREGGGQGATGIRCSLYIMVTLELANIINHNFCLHIFIMVSYWINKQIDL